MTSDPSDTSSEKTPASTDVGPPPPQFPQTVEKTYALPEETISRIKTEAERDQTSESEALVKMVAAYLPGV